MRFRHFSLILPLVLGNASSGFAQEPMEVQGEIPTARADTQLTDHDGDVAELPEFVSLAEIQDRLQRTEDLALNRAPLVQWSGYIDTGFFATSGDGSGYVQDYGHRLFPEYSNRYGWVFLGDILAPTINSRGEVADLGSAPGVERFDSINSRGAPGFVMNEANIALRAAVRPNAIATASLNITPRTGRNFHLGDTLDLDIAQIEWLPTESQRTSIFVGKIESVIGIEYRNRKANRRFGITPSLIARYTIEPAVGIKIRTKFGGADQFVVAAAVTNGSNTSERFHFYDEVDSNAAKTGSARLSLKLPISGEVELGASGSYGAQDRTTSNDGIMWFAGPDLLATFGNIDIKAQFLLGRAPGRAIDDVYGLDLKGGGYLEINWMLTSNFGVLGRGEFRNARVWLGDERLYLTKSWRATAGVRWVLAPNSAIKAEFLKNGEFGGLPAVRNDVFTSSLVLSF